MYITFSLNSEITDEQNINRYWKSEVPDLIKLYSLILVVPNINFYVKKYIYKINIARLLAKVYYV